ncbi:aminoglycoside phosphotransferase family protein [Streptomyces sp. XM4193]|uniref:phosphotransferase enzyme family protein n=1 Tax=Streptomyces sp. XM4193 TaxID=2929782 RepID=UPI001FFB7A32|nr:aminoglycoside phosphotransferase family protein [Streptomyces sp. XM4193]MCK1795751.1 aminoglycoside phosphotransferase family protein [Streptomyces sp. XM4193]
MHVSEVPRAVAAATSIASSLGLPVDRSTVLQNSNKLSLRLLPCDVLARVAPAGQHVAEFEVELAQRLADARCPVAALDPRTEPRVHELDAYVVTFWTHHTSSAAGEELPPAAYADALARLHRGMKQVDTAAPRFTDGAAHAQHLVDHHDLTPELPLHDRQLLSETLRTLRRRFDACGASEQLIHGEPHPGNLLLTEHGPLFIDLETCCRGPIEFDLAHAPEEVANHYPGVDRDLLHDCRLLVLAMITTWRWDRTDQLPDGRRLATEWLARLRSLTGRQD